jgi:hypothetical protein
VSSKEGAFSEDEEPQTSFNFTEHFGYTFDADKAYFELSKDESELRMRYFDSEKDIIDEYLMTETSPGEGFTQIDK